MIAFSSLQILLMAISGITAQQFVQMTSVGWTQTGGSPFDCTTTSDYCTLTCPANRLLEVKPDPPLGVGPSLKRFLVSCYANRPNPTGAARSISFHTPWQTGATGTDVLSASPSMCNRIACKLNC